MPDAPALQSNANEQANAPTKLAVKLKAVSAEDKTIDLASRGTHFSLKPTSCSTATLSAWPTSASGWACP
jgi:hypothetical protein